MNKKNDKGMDNQKYNVEELLDFLDGDDTYLVVDDQTGIVGNKKTGVMIDRRTGKVFFEDSAKTLVDELPNSGLKYDFLDYKKSVDVLNNSEISRDVVKSPSYGMKISNEQKFKLRNYFGRNLPKKSVVFKNDNILNNDKEICVFEETFKEKETDKNSDNRKDSEDNLSIDIRTQTDEEILRRINEKFESIEDEFREFRDDNFSKNVSDDQKNLSIEKNDKEFGVKDDKHADINSIIDLRSNEFEKFKTIVDFEEYFESMPDDEEILKSPFDNIKDYEIPKAVVEEDQENDDSFMPFDVLPDFEVEEIQSYDISGEDIIKDGMIPDLNLNQGMSKKVSIREVIKNKQKKKQEQKELQEKLFFETIDDRIDQFKKIKEHSIDSQEILNAINTDLNKINSSIKIEFESLNKKRKISKSKATASNKNSSADDKFSLQNLLEEIYDEKGEKAHDLNSKELNIESINKDLVKKEMDKNIVN